jgi:hypothetical protein
LQLQTSLVYLGAKCASLLVCAEPVTNEEKEHRHWLASPLLNRGLPHQLPPEHPLMHPFFGFQTGGAAGEGNGVALADEREGWRRKARAYLDQAAAPKAPKPQRTAALQHLLCVNNILSALAGRDLEAFHVPFEHGAWPASPSRWPSLSLVSDQGSDAMAGASFLLAQGYNCTMLHDPCHRCWNDTLGAVASARLRSTMYALVLLCNLDSGPWGSERWYQSAKGAAAAYCAASNEQCPLLTS